MADYTSRTVTIKIYNSDGTVKYDTSSTPDIGIIEGSMHLNKTLCNEELKFGTLGSSMFEVEMFGIEDVSDLKITVEMQDNDTLDKEALFVGYIESSKLDNSDSDRQVIAYDWLYYNRDCNIADFWNVFWEIDTSARLVDFTSQLFGGIGIDPTLLNFKFSIDDVRTSMTINRNTLIYNDLGTITKLTFGELLSYIGQISCRYPTIISEFNDDGDVISILSLVRLVTTDTVIDLTDSYEGLNSTWEDYTTNAVTGVGVYSTSNDLMQLEGTDDNVYNIVGNIFLINREASEITTICTNILNYINQIVYTPCDIKMIVSNPAIKLGDKISTPNGLSYVFEIDMSGSLLVEQEIKCESSGKNLNNEVSTINDTVVQGTKISKVEQNIDGLTVEVGDLADNTEAQFSVTNSQIVMKVDSDGNLVVVSLGTDPDDSSATRFQVEADNISFISGGGSINLTDNTLSISSTNFSVTSSGKITATSGTIGGWNISSGSLNKTIETYIYPDITEVETVKQIILNGTTPTSDQLKWFDYDGDGDIDARDLLAVRRLQLGIDTIDAYPSYEQPQFTTIVRLNPNNPDSFVWLQTTAYGRTINRYLGVKRSNIGPIPHDLNINKDAGKIYTHNNGTSDNYMLIGDNGSNLWIGAQSTTNGHHDGQTYISAGWDYSASAASSHTIFVCVPSSANAGTSYEVWHAGNLVKGKTTVSSIGANASKTFTISAPTALIGSSPVVTVTPTNYYAVCGISSITTSGSNTVVTVTVHNNGSSSISPTINYIAVRN